MERLNMSLDQLIEKNQENKKSNFGNRKNTKGGNNRNNRSNDKPKSFGAAPKKQHNNDSDDRNAEPYVRRPVEVRQPLIYRPLKIVSSSERERIQQPNAASSGSNSVFARLGKQPASGTYVHFSNLKKSVEGRDLEELCGSVGEVKEVEKSGTGVAKVLFARRTDAVTCVSKFNGLTLDGLVMTVALAEDAESARPKSIFDRLAPKNVKEGVFGTAMGGSDDEQEEPQQELNFLRHGGNSGNGRVRAASREPVFQVTLGGASNVKFSDNDRDNNNHNARREPRSAHRQVESRNGGDRRPQSAGRGGSNPRKQGGGGRNGGGERPAKKEVNLDDDLDAYMAAR